MIRSKAVIRGRTGISVFMFMIITATLFAPSNHAAEKDVFVYALPFGFEEFNLFTFKSYATTQWMNAIFASTYDYLETPNNAGNTKYQPVLAEELPSVKELSDDSNTSMIVTFKLKKGLKFSNGDSLTAEDVAFSIEYQATLGPRKQGSSKDVWGEMLVPFNVKARAVDSLTVELYFKQKTAYYMELLLLPIFPQSVYLPAIDSGRLDFESEPFKYLIGAGPFKLKKIDAPASITLEKNEYWSRTELAYLEIDELVFKKVESKEEVIEGLKNGTIDLADKHYQLLDKDLENAKGVNIITVPSLRSEEIAINQIHPVWGHTAQLDAFMGATFNYSSSHENYTVYSFWDKISGGKMTEEKRVRAAQLVREAMSYIIPREGIVEKILEQRGQPLETPLPLMILPQGVVPREYSVEKARELIKQAFELAGWQNITVSENTQGIFVGNLMDYFEDWSVTPLSPITNPYRNQWTFRIELELPKLGIEILVHPEPTDNLDLRTTSFNISMERYSLPTGLHTPVPLWKNGGYDIFFTNRTWNLAWNLEGLWETWAWLPVGNNFYNYWDLDLEMLLNNYTTQVQEPLERQETFQKIVKRLYEFLPSIPIIYWLDTWAYNGKWAIHDYVFESKPIFEWWEIGKPGDEIQDGIISSSFVAILLTIGIATLPMRRRKKRKGENMP